MHIGNVRGSSISRDKPYADRRQMFEPVSYRINSAVVANNLVRLKITLSATCRLRLFTDQYRGNPFDR